MPFSIEAALRRGIDRTVARNGLLLVGVLFVVSTINGIVGFGVARWIADRGFVPMNFSFPWEVGTAPYAVPPSLGGFVSLLAGIATIVITIGALRVLVSDERERLPSESFTRNMIWPGLNFFVGSIIFGLIVGFGFVLLIIPGFFLLVTLAFWAIYVAVEDRNFIDGMQRSWALTRGHRLRLFLLGVAVVLIEVIVDLALGFGGGPTSVLGIVITQLGSALTTIFALATLAAAYDQLIALPTEVEARPADVDSGTVA